MADTAAPPELSDQQQQAMAGDSGPSTPPPTAKPWQQAVEGAIRNANPSPQLETTRTAPAPNVGEQAPTVLTPVKQHGLMGVMDEVRNWIAGTQGTGIYIDQATGQRYVQHPPLTPAQQWAKIGSEAFTGAAAGFAAGRGAGNQGKAVAAGVQAQQQAFQQESQTQEENAQANYARNRQAQIDKADQQIKQLQVTQAGLNLHRTEVETNEAMEKLYTEQSSRLETQGGVKIPGTYTSDDIHTVQQQHPEFFSDHFKFNSIQPVIKPNGGVEFWSMPKDRYTSPVNDDDAKRGVPTYVPNEDPTKPGEMRYSPIPSGSMSQGSYDTALDAATKRMTDDAKRISDQKKADAGAVPKTSAEARAFASAATDPAEKQRYTTLAKQMLSDEIAERQASRTQVNVGPGLGNMGAVGGAGTGPNETYLQSLPAEYQNQVRSFAEGDTKLPTAARGNKENLALRQMVFNYDPSYTDARYTAKQNFKNGQDALSITQLATAMDHVDKAMAHSKEVGTAPFLHMNATAADAAYNQDVKMFAQEAGKLVKSGVITQGEYEDLKNGMDSRRQGIRDAALKETVDLVGGKVRGLMQKYKTAVGRDLPVSEYFDQASQERLGRYGIIPQQGAPPPTQQTAPTPQAAREPTPPAGATTTYRDPQTRQVVGWMVNGKYVKAGQ